MGRRRKPPAATTIFSVLARLFDIVESARANVLDAVRYAAIPIWNISVVLPFGNVRMVRAVRRRSRRDEVGLERRCSDCRGWQNDASDKARGSVFQHEGPAVQVADCRDNRQS